jgi:hypothetical protein
MANLCDTQYKITGEKKAVADLWNTLQEMNVNEKNVWLGDLAKHYGIDYKSKGFSVRGEIYWAEYEEYDDHSLLSFDTETAWTACNDFFDALNDKLDGALSISYREIECGCGIFCVHDEGEYFPEECCVSANGEPFETMCEEPFDTLADAIEEWCEKMGIKRDGRSDEEMHELISEYEYKDSDTYFYINKFEFE